VIQAVLFDGPDADAHAVARRIDPNDLPFEANFDLVAQRKADGKTLRRLHLPFGTHEYAIHADVTNRPDQPGSIRPNEFNTISIQYTAVPPMANAYRLRHDSPRQPAATRLHLYERRPVCRPAFDFCTFLANNKQHRDAPSRLLKNAFGLPSRGINAKRMKKAGAAAKEVPITETRVSLILDKKQGRDKIETPPLDAMFIRRRKGTNRENGQVGR